MDRPEYEKVCGCCGEIVESWEPETEESYICDECYFNMLDDSDDYESIFNDIQDEEDL